MESQLEEVVPFLEDGRANVRFTALEVLLSVSSSAEFMTFLRSRPTLIDRLVELVSDETVVAESAIKLLVNASGDPLVQRRLDTEKALANVFRVVVNPSAGHADFAAMLLSNVTRLESACGRLAQLEDPTWRGSRVLRLVSLLDAAENTRRCELHHVASVVANVTRVPEVRAVLLAGDGATERLAMLARQAGHDDVTRRLGALAAIKYVPI